MIPEITPVNTYSGNDSTTIFDFNFYIENENQIVVYHTDKDGVQTILTKDTDYSIHAVGNENGSYITFPLAGSTYPILKAESSQGAGDAEKISICLTLPISQESEFGTSSKMNLKSMELSFDKLTRICQILSRKTDRAIKVQEGSSATPDALLEIINTKALAAQNSATSAATSATAAETAETNAETAEANAETTYNNTVSKYNEVVSTVATEKAAIETLSTNQQTAITNLGNATKTNIQALGIYMENGRLFYFDTNGIKHEFRNDFGGIAPMQIKHKEIKKVDEGFELYWVDPDDSAYENNVYCNWDNTVIVRKENSYPESPFDGDVVITSDVRNQYAETPYIDEVDNTKDYKYRAFPCSINGVYSLHDDNKFGAWIYSFTKIKAESVPSKKIIYRGSNEHYEEMKMNFTSGINNEGDWKDAPFLLKDRLTPCMVYNTDSANCGEVAYFLDKNNYKKKEDGTTSDVTDTSKPMNAFMRIKLMYRWKRKDASGNELVDISNVKVNDNYKPYGDFVKSDGTLREYVYLPIYRGSLVSGKARSMSGGLTPMSGQTAQSERTYCQANGAGHDMITSESWEMIRDLFHLLYKTTDSQSALGQGKSDGGNSVAACLVSGTMDDKGYFFGSTSTSVGVKFLGMENRWASQWERVLGWVMVDGVQKVKRCQGTSDGSSVSDFNFTGEGYIALTELPTLSGTSGGYISQMQTVDDVGTFPTVVSGSSSTNECDGMWYNNAGAVVALRGGASRDGAICGVSCSSLHVAASFAYWDIGSSVSYKPL
ncbi:MAG: hypothetical protein PHV37_09005 [Candidatus Gastranaerophilales bacterium]|nr:hypothetical protein [Candidatus Gastranaerophilales bacterium]